MINLGDAKEQKGVAVLSPPRQEPKSFYFGPSQKMTTSVLFTFLRMGRNKKLSDPAHAAHGFLFGQKCNHSEAFLEIYMSFSVHQVLR